jgi:putative endonuclease
MLKDLKKTEVRIPPSPFFNLELGVYFAYILKSCKSGIHYYGSSADPQKRLFEHNAGKQRFTKGHMPWILIYQEAFTTRAEAVKRERFFKSIEGYQWLKDKAIL